nr:hypothetical protein [Pseudonocardia sp. AL041005-10]
MTQTVGGAAVAGLVLLAAGRTVPGVVTLGLAVAVLVLVSRARAALARPAVGHAHGAGRALLRHEGGHLHAASKVGARVRSATVSKDSGLVELHRADVDRMSSRQYMAFMKAGRAAAGSAVGCSADDANVRDERRRMSRSGMSAAEIRRVERQADGDARSWARSGQVDRWADRLGERGRL